MIAAHALGLALMTQSSRDKNLKTRTSGVFFGRCISHSYGVFKQGTIDQISTLVCFLPFHFVMVKYKKNPLIYSKYQISDIFVVLCLLCPCGILVGRALAFYIKMLKCCFFLFLTKYQNEEPDVLRTFQLLSLVYRSTSFI